jgi:hypothetical protein
MVLPGVRQTPPSHRLQANDCRAMGHISLNQFKVMPQSALPKMPGGCGEDMACGT